MKHELETNQGHRASVKVTVAIHAQTSIENRLF